jgi:hypothetical protein
MPGASLTDWRQGRFVPVRDGPKTHYGCHQKWLADEGVSAWRANRSCGVAAAANALAYMSSHVPGMERLYPGQGLALEQFRKFEKSLFEALQPLPTGVASIGHFRLGVERYARSMGVKLRAKALRNPKNAAQAELFLAGALQNERPVCLLTWNAGQKDLRWHWICITRLEGESMVSSNWSSMRSYSLPAWVGERSLSKGLVYFE